MFQLNYQKLFLLTGLLALPACERIPQDPDNTLDRVKEEQVFRVGFVTSGIGVGSNQRALVSRLEEAVGAKAQVEHGAADTLLSELEEGGLDVVIGDFQTATPWATMATFVPAAETLADRGLKIATMAVAKSGENEWIALLHREAEFLERQP